MNLEEIIEFYGQTKKSHILFKNLQEIGEVYLIGGIARNLYRNRHMEKNRLTYVRDIDIIIDAKNHYQIFESLIKKHPHKLNKFGGYKIEINSMKVDIWEIRDTWAYKNNIVKCNKNDMGSNLQNTVFLNYDAVVYYSNEALFYSGQYEKCLRDKMIDIVLEENPQIYLNLLRALEFRVKTGFSFSHRLNKLFYKYYYQDVNLIKCLYNIETYRENILTVSAIEEEIRNIVATVDQTNY